jgi:Ca2+/Na+ antiporter
VKNVIEEILTSYVFEKLNKQIIRKLPYCLFFALLIHLLIGKNDVFLILAPIFFVAFLIFSPYFNYEVNKTTGKLWSNLDFKGIITMISRIFEGGASWLKDMGIAKKKALIISGFLSGIFFSFTLTLVFLLFLNSISLNTAVLVAFTIIVALYIVQDVAKPNLLEEPEKENKLSLMYDVMDAYIVENSLRSLPLSRTISKVGFVLLTRTIAPLTYFSLPKFAYKEMIVFNNSELKQYLRRYIEGQEDVRLKWEDGQSFDNFFVTDDNYENISVFSNRSPKEIFPYLLNPQHTYSGKDRKKWIALTILKKQSGREATVGQVFIHMFRGKFTTTTPRPHSQDFDGKPKKREILLFIFLGERSIVQYLETRIGTMTIKCPLNKLAGEG